jgi:signal peptidase I
MANTTASKVLGTAFNVIVGRDKKRHAHGDPVREVFETIVFVVVLVLMLKLFVAEAFVIPTGSMASTLWGDQVKVECPECGYTFPVSAAVRGQEQIRSVPSEVICQNCGNAFAPQNSRDWNSGDRVLVAKYDYHIRDPRRFDVPVFRFPEYPYSKADKSAMNYIKRLIGLPGETIAIYKGDLYRTTSLKYEQRRKPDRPEDTWRLRWPAPIDPSWEEPDMKAINDPLFTGFYIPSRDFTYTSDPDALALFEKGGFEPIRKEPKEILAVRRLVFDLDKQPKSLTGIAKTRWNVSPEEPTGWAEIDKGFQHTGEGSGWIRYWHVQSGWGRAANPPRQPAEIMDDLGYNSPQHGTFWVPDLIVDCRAEFTAATDRLTLELTKGGDKYQAVFDNGDCRLYRISPSAPDRPVMLAQQKSGITTGRYDLRFANVDSRLTVWVDGTALKFGPGADYPPPDRNQFDKTTADINEPARIGAAGGVTVSRIQLWRDVYYTPGDHQIGIVETHYVQPGHYLCMGDNSASSSDGRTWGLVPERLMLGRAVVIYWPLSRIRVIK